MPFEKAVRWGPVTLVMSTALCIGLTIGLFPALLSLNVEARGYDTSWNGLLAAMHGIAGLAVGPFVPRLMARLGALRTYVAAVALAASTVLLFTVFQDLKVWFLLRFILGVGLGIQWIVSETWVNQVALGPRRGAIISIYVVILSVGLALGPLIMTIVGTLGAAPFLVSAALIALSCLPLLFLPAQTTVDQEYKKALSLLAAFLRKPSAMLAAAMDGFIFQAFMAFLPIYFLRLGTSEALAIGMLNAFFVGGIVMQILVGYLLDRFTPAKVLLASCLLLLVGLLVIADRSLGADTLWLVLFLMGGPAAAIYTAGLASVTDAFTAEEMPTGTAIFTMIWHIGGLSGPALAGLAMDWWNPFGFSLTIAVSLIILAVANAASFKQKAHVD
jgi:MFS family permease